MIIYRPHRGSLKDAMAEARVFQSVDEMKAWIVDSTMEVTGVLPFAEDDIVIGSDAVDDPRNGWRDTRYVCIKRFVTEEYDTPQCIGMCATDFPKP